MILPIVTGEATPMLVEPSKKVKDPLAPEIQNLIPVMFESMHAARGIGLAAPQIGESIRMAVIEIEGDRTVLINPKITSFSKSHILFEEGCLSLPGRQFLIERSEKVTVRYTNERGEAMKTKATGLFAVAIQHEVDHLDGILIAERSRTQKAKNIPYAL